MVVCVEFCPLFCVNFAHYLQQTTEESWRVYSPGFLHLSVFQFSVGFLPFWNFELKKIIHSIKVWDCWCWRISLNSIQLTFFHYMTSNKRIWSFSKISNSNKNLKKARKQDGWNTDNNNQDEDICLSKSGCHNDNCSSKKI